MEKADTIAGYLRTKGLVPTFARVEVVQFLQGNPSHPTVDEVYQSLKNRIPSLSKTTVYNILRNLVDMLNKALEMEQAANVQYLSMAELVDGLYAEPIMQRLQEIAGDEREHAEKLRTLINDYLDAFHGPSAHKES